MPSLLLGCGVKISPMVLRKVHIDLSKRAGELTECEVECVITIMRNPCQDKVPDWFLNRQKDMKDRKCSQVLANDVDNKFCEEVEWLKKIQAHRVLCCSGVFVFEASTPNQGCRGRTVGMSYICRPCLLLSSLYT